MINTCRDTVRTHRCPVGLVFILAPIETQMMPLENAEYPSNLLSTLNDASVQQLSGAEVVGAIFHQFSWPILTTRALRRVDVQRHSQLPNVWNQGQ